MEQIFDTVLELSLAGSVIILVILALRLVLRAVPQRYVCLLWILAGLRLLVPFSFESSFSLQPDPNAIEQWMPTQAVTQPETPVITPAVGEGMQLPQMDENHDAVSNPRPVTVDWAALGWAVVAGCFLMYMAGSYLLLKRKVRGAVAVDGNIYECGGIDSPFVLGYLRPRIYLPEDLPSEDIDHILVHEQCHIRRADHWIKLMGFVCLAVHWFNPLVWLAYGLLCRDVEMACDEEVVAGLSADGRKAYSATLLRCVSGHRLGAVCPVAFGEVSVKQRIPKILHFRKPTFWIGVVAGVVVAVVAMCFLTDPASDPADKENIPEFTTPTSHIPSQEEQYVDQCREALAAFQALDTYGMSVTITTSDDVWPKWNWGQFYYNEDDWYQWYSTSDWTDQYLFYDGKGYTKDITKAVPEKDIPYPQWTQVDLNDDYFTQETEQHWLTEFAWNDEQMEYIDHSTGGYGLMVRVAWRSGRTDTVHFTFVFNPEGTLNTVIQEIWDVPGNEATGYRKEEIDLIDSKQNIATVIAQTAGEVANSGN